MTGVTLCIMPFLRFRKKNSSIFQKIGKCPLLYFVMIFVVVDIAEYPSVPYRFGKRGSVRCHGTQQTVFRAVGERFTFMAKEGAHAIYGLYEAIHTYIDIPIHFLKKRNLAFCFVFLTLRLSAAHSIKFFVVLDNNCSCILEIYSLILIKRQRT